MINKEEFYVNEDGFEKTLEVLAELFPQPEYSIGIRDLPDVELMPKVKGVKMIAVIGNPKINDSTFDRRGFVALMENNMTVIMFNTKTPYMGLLTSLSVATFFLVMDIQFISWMMIFSAAVFVFIYLQQIAELFREIKRCEKKFSNTYKFLDVLGVEITKAFSGLKVKFAKERLSNI